MLARVPVAFSQSVSELFGNAQELLREIIDKKLLTAHAVYGFYPANSDGDDIILYSDPTRTETLTRLHTLRQQKVNSSGKPQLALADYIAPKESGRIDYIGAFAVTAGHGCQELAERFERENDQYNAIMAKALADRLAEAFAELLHKRAREDWGYGKEERFSPEDLIAEFVAYGDPFRSGIARDLVRGLDERAHQRFLLGGSVTRHFGTDLVAMNGAVHKVKIIYGHECERAVR